MFNPERVQPLSSEAARIVAGLGVGLTVVLALAALPLGFAAGTACTNHFSCTETVCNAACDRVNVAGFYDLLGQLVVFVALCVGIARDRLYSVLIPLVGLALSAEIGWAAYHIAMSWTRAT